MMRRQAPSSLGRCLLVSVISTMLSAVSPIYRISRLHRILGSLLLYQDRYGRMRHVMRLDKVSCSGQMKHWLYCGAVRPRLRHKIAADVNRNPQAQNPGMSIFRQDRGKQENMRLHRDICDPRPTPHPDGGRWYRRKAFPRALTRLRRLAYIPFSRLFSHLFTFTNRLSEKESQ